MSALKTYTRGNALDGTPEKWPFVLTEGCGDDTCCPLAPGSFVQHYKRGGFGMVVAQTDDQMTILWSVMPRNMTLLDMEFPPLKKVKQEPISQVITSVQPMTAPVSGVFFLDYQYPTGSLGE